MVKRKEAAGVGAIMKPQDPESSDEDTDMIDVDFEWFDPQEIDFHGLKMLMRQLFDVDADLFDLSALANLILSQPGLGSTVKVSDGEVDAKETDPYAFLTVLNLQHHREKPEIQSLIRYITSKASSPPSPALSTTLPSLFAPSSPAQVGLILTERFINMPPQIIPPMYAMLLEEIDIAVNDKDPYTFTHYLILSKTYVEIASALDDQDTRPPAKKTKKSSAGAGGGSGEKETFYFHAEDEVFERFAVESAGFEYTKAGDPGASDARRAFQEAGIKPMGRLTLIEAGRFREAVEAVKEYVNA